MTGRYYKYFVYTLYRTISCKEHCFTDVFIIHYNTTSTDSPHNHSVSLTILFKELELLIFKFLLMKIKINLHLRVFFSYCYTLHLSLAKYNPIINHRLHYHIIYRNLPASEYVRLRLSIFQKISFNLIPRKL